MLSPAAPVDANATNITANVSLWSGTGGSPAGGRSDGYTSALNDSSVYVARGMCFDND